MHPLSCSVGTGPAALLRVRYVKLVLQQAVAYLLFAPVLGFSANKCFVAYESHCAISPLLQLKHPLANPTFVSGAHALRCEFRFVC